jgi:hypothetical protein
MPRYVEVEEGKVLVVRVFEFSSFDASKEPVGACSRMMHADQIAQRPYSLFAEMFRE